MFKLVVHKFRLMRYKYQVLLHPDQSESSGRGASCKSLVCNNGNCKICTMLSACDSPGPAFPKSLSIARSYPILSIEILINFPCVVSVCSATFVPSLPFLGDGDDGDDGDLSGGCGGVC